MHGVTYVDSNTNGYIWSAIYDGLGRRLATTTIFITNGVTVSSLPKTISQYLDPNVQFLELGETDSGGTTWKFYGPDLNGVYGGMQGVGGLDAVVNGPRQSSPVVSDIRGNGYAIFNLSQGSLVWYSSRVTAYGAVEGYRPLPLADGAKDGSSQRLAGQMGGYHWTDWPAIATMARRMAIGWGPTRSATTPILRYTRFARRVILSILSTRMEGVWNGGRHGGGRPAQCHGQPRE